MTPPPPNAAIKPPATLEAELAAVLAKLEEANQKKDLQQLMSLYSPSFPDLPQKAQEISRSWAAYDYLSLNFKLTEIKSPTPDSASARVTWKIKTRQRQTQKIKDITKVYLVSFTCESGQWRIQVSGKSRKGCGPGQIFMKPWGSFRSFLLLTLLLVLAGACATPPPHSPEGDYYLTADMTYLRDAATFDSNVVGQLYKGDQVEKLDVGPAGWWRVRSGRTGQIGWVSADLFSPTPVPVPLFVVTQTVNLRECPKELCPVPAAAFPGRPGAKDRTE